MFPFWLCPSTLAHQAHGELGVIAPELAAAEAATLLDSEVALAQQSKTG